MSPVNENEIDGEAFWQFADPPEPESRESGTASRTPDRAFVGALAALLIAAFVALGYTQLAGRTDDVSVGSIPQDLQAAAGLNPSEAPADAVGIAADAAVEIAAAPNDGLPESVFVVATATPPPPPPTPLPEPTPEPTAAPEPEPTAVPEPAAPASTEQTEAADTGTESAPDAATTDDSAESAASDGDPTDENDSESGSDSTDETGDTDNGDSSTGDADGANETASELPGGDQGDGGDSTDDQSDGDLRDAGQADGDDLGLDPNATPDAGADSDLAVIASEMTAWINEVRSASGVAPVAAHDGLAARSRMWSQIMGSRFGTIAHCDTDPCAEAPIPADCKPWAENVAQGVSLELIKGALLESPENNEKIRDGQFDHVGVGVAWLDGSWWVTQVFAVC